MLNEELIFAATCDFSGLVRGKAFPAIDLPSRLTRGLGWTPTNIMISPLGPIWDTPFGTAGDLMLLPDPATEVRVDFGDGSPADHLILCDLRHTDGGEWECCPRRFLRRAISALEGQGLRLYAAFEQEFVYTGVEAFPASPYSLRAFREQRGFASTVSAALRAAELQHETFLAEYGPRQFEITIAPGEAMAAADHAVIARELVRGTAFRLGHRAIFCPMLDPQGTGNGVHIHMSLRDKQGRPISHESGAPLDLSEMAAHFFAGILHHLPALCAITAPSPVSYLRLTPNRWAPTLCDIAVQDRNASLRIAPVFGSTNEENLNSQFNVEFRPADAAASPYLALAAIIFAGVDGLQKKMEVAPVDASASQNKSNIPSAEIRRLPQSLGAALDALEQTPEAATWFGPPHLDAYLRAKRAEDKKTCALDPAALCVRYSDVY